MTTILLLAAANFLCFLAGKAVGRLETIVSFPQQLTVLIQALNKVENLCALKGQKMSDLSSQELIQRVNEQLALMRDGK